MIDIKKIILIVIAASGLGFISLSIIELSSVMYYSANINELCNLEYYEHHLKIFNILKGICELIFMSIGFIVFIHVLINKKI